MAPSSTTATDLTLRSPSDDDWSAMSRLAATCFGSFRQPEVDAMWRSMVPDGGALIASDGPDVVGMCLYLDMQLTVPGGAVLPVAGMTWVAVAPTHRRRGILRRMYTEMHRRIADAGYPIAALTASEATIYGRFGYGPATTEQTVSIERRRAEFHADVADPGGVRLVEPARFRDEMAAIYERWRLRTPGGLHSPTEMWDEVLADRETARHGGSPLFGLLHGDGFALYRVHGYDPKTVQVTKLVAVTTDAYVALWRTLLGLDLMEKVVVPTHASDPLPYLLTDPRLVCTTGTEDALWLRMMDIPAVLEARSYRGDFSAVLEIADDFLGQGGRFSLDVHDGKARCSPSSAEPDVRMDLAVLGSLYMGVHRASAYAFANRLHCKDSELLRQLNSIFASDVPAELGYGF
jgi:predicted acetyltransferase